MKFDVIIGNPPYQLADSGHGASSAPIYQLFYRQAVALRPRTIALVIPARWFSGGKGLSKFRAEMLEDYRISKVVDFPDSSRVFPDVQIKGGVCVVVRSESPDQLLEVATKFPGGKELTWNYPSEARKLDVFLRFPSAYSILKKVESKSTVPEAFMTGRNFSSLVSIRKPFGIGTQFRSTRRPAPENLVVVSKEGEDWISASQVTQNRELIDTWKVFVPRLSSGSDSFPHYVLGRPFLGPPGVVCTETYLAVGPLESEQQAKNVISYMNTRFFRFLCLLRKASQDAPRSVYKFVPIQSFAKSWSDEELYEFYQISNNEISEIEQLVRLG